MGAVAEVAKVIHFRPAKVETASAHMCAQAGHTPPPGQAGLASVHAGFGHAIHVGMFIAIAFMLLASVVSFVFVRSHVQRREGDAVEAFAA